ncbi:MAG: Mov34/MPN/PAD-1 family protein [Gemmatimonadaceae bacterium]
MPEATSPPDSLTITHTAWEAALAHMRESWPNEGVGFFLGPSKCTALTFVPARNVRAGREFIVDPHDQYLAFRQARDGGQALVALCHSHPGGGTGLSQQDRTMLADWPFLHVVVALASQRSVARASAWSIQTDQAVAVPFLIEGAPRDR